MYLHEIYWALHHIVISDYMMMILGNKLKNEFEFLTKVTKSKVGDKL